jgi:hypothetical protein
LGATFGSAWPTIALSPARSGVLIAGGHADGFHDALKARYQSAFERDLG